MPAARRKNARLLKRLRRAGVPIGGDYRLTAPYQLPGSVAIMPRGTHFYHRALVQLDERLAA